MYDDIYPIAPPPGGTVPEGVRPYQPPRRRRIGLLAASAVLVAGVGAGGFAIGQLAGGEDHEGFAATTSQSADDGGAAVAESDSPAPPPVQQVGEEQDD